MKNGGAAFIIIYLICILIIGLPVLIAEVLLGRNSQLGPISTFRTLTKKHRPFWITVGGIFFFTGLIILSYYNVIAGWSMGYIVEAIRGAITNFQTSADASVHFGNLVSNPKWIILWQLAFVAMGGLVVYFGVKKGIERIAKFLMPVFFVILLFLVVLGSISSRK